MNDGAALTRARRRIRLRASTAALIVIFLGTLVLYLFIRPAASSPSSTPVTAVAHR